METYELPPKIQARVLKEATMLKKLIDKNEIFGVEFCLINENPRHVMLTLDGPPDTVYTGGKFNFEVFYTEEYPHKPPLVKLKTKIYHPNINDYGDICLNILKADGDWTPTTTLMKLAMSLQGLLESPNLDDPLNIKVSEHFKHNKKEADQRALDYTKKYAI
jgi:ubiquitin-protein ligase